MFDDKCIAVDILINDYQFTFIPLQFHLIFTSRSRNSIPLSTEFRKKNIHTLLFTLEFESQNKTQRNEWNANLHISCLCCLEMMFYRKNGRSRRVLLMFDRLIFFCWLCIHEPNWRYIVILLSSEGFSPIPVIILEDSEQKNNEIAITTVYRTYICYMHNIFPAHKH